MKVLPFAVEPIHFVGIGGIGMSGIAEILHNLGYRVQGSDLGESRNVQRLRRLGIDIAIGHRPENLGEAKLLVVSSAVGADNPELLEGRARRLPVVPRAEMLGELMRFKWSVAVAGTHGKTTTTSMIAAILDAGGLDPTVINGGIINAYKTNARLGAGDWMVVEADESDGSFLRLPATIAVITNIDPEHMDHYGSFDAVRRAYLAFVEQLPFYGVAVLCIDHPEVQALLPRITDRRVVTYGFNPQADIRACDPRLDAEGEHFTVIMRGPDGEEQVLEDVHLAMPGLHNVANALAALAVGRQLGIGAEAMRRALARLEGVQRRFTRTGRVAGITVIDDYGHHPVEIRNVLRTARAATPAGRVIAVVQPHRYTRLRDLFEDFCTCFVNADIVLVAPVHAAGEPPIEGIDRDALVKGLRAHGQREVHAIDGEDDLAPLLARHARAGDLVVCLGAGTITRWAQELPQRLAALLGAEMEP